MLLLLYCLQLLFKVLQMSGSCFDCYVVYHYSLMFDRGVVHVVFVMLSTITVSGLTEEGCSCCCCYIVYH
jgi:hypothetical protein